MRLQPDAGCATERKAPSPGWHALALADVEQLLGARLSGLSQAEHEERLVRYGPNQLREEPGPNSADILLHQFESPLIYVLLLAGVVSAVLCEYIDAGVIAAVLVINATIGFVQERQAEQSVRALL